MNIPGWIAAGSLVVGVCTFIFAVVKGRSDRRQQQSFKAKEVWSDYMKFAFDHPEFSGGFDFNNSQDSLKREQYEWFVSRMFYACEEAISYAPKDRLWKGTLMLQLDYHRDYLCGGHFDRAIRGYCRPLQEIFTSWRISACAPAG